jgi:predicted NUDIX family NTP pyrophosphohydrolase
MPTQSAGILLYRKRKRMLEVFLIHPGGPFWKRKDDGAWSIPKGAIAANEDPRDAAKREFKEETGFDVDDDLKLLGTYRQPGGKLVTAYAAQGDCDPTKLVSNTFSMTWPPRSGKIVEFPEVDRGAWFARADAEVKILKGQKPILDAFFGPPAIHGSRI